MKTSQFPVELNRIIQVQKMYCEYRYIHFFTGDARRGMTQTQSLLTSYWLDKYSGFPTVAYIN